ncbi:MAG: HemK family protein methyltransferase [Candidatus Pacebacteria bacterium]|nr:HemK family protein methyltransferase [Candidatus Paceibacterota bacterium]
MNSINEQEKKWLLDEKYHGNKNDEYYRECNEIDNGMPVAYLIGNIEFLDCHIDLEYRPLIPRAETEYWVNIFIKQNKKKRNLKILDLFSGSGCIGIAVSKHLNAEVDFAEIDAKNILQINKNKGINKITKGNVFQSDVFSNIPEKKYDFILANPPYLDRNKVSQVQDSVLYNEDDHALFADQQGLKFVYELINIGAEYIKDGGEIWIEFDPWQTDLIDEYLIDNNQWNHSYLEDQYKKDRVLILKNLT